MTSRISAQMPSPAPAADDTPSLQLPEFLRVPFSAAMAQSVLLPAFIALFGILAALFLVGFAQSAMTRKGGGRPQEHGAFGRGYDEDDDDDDYVEVVLRREPGLEEGATETLAARFGHPHTAPANAWHSDPVGPWHGLLADPVWVPQVDPIGFAHNGFHVNNGQRFRPSAPVSPPAFGPTRHDHPLVSPSARRQTGSEGARARSSGHDSSARHQLADGEPPRNKHDRADPEDPASGRHSSQ
jgi:hypothetical protein